MSEIIDLRDSVINPVPSETLRSGFAVLDWVVAHGELCYDGIDAGIIGSKKDPHLYIANSLAELVDLDENPATRISKLIIGSALYAKERLQNGRLLVSARTWDAYESPHSPTLEVPASLSIPLQHTGPTLTLLAESFQHLRADALTTAEANKYKGWCGRVMQITIDPYSALRGEDND